MFTVQHFGPKLGDFVGLTKYPTLAEAVASAKRIITPWASGDSRSDGQKRNPEDYRIVSTDARGRLLVHDIEGNRIPAKP